jgi:N6-L-threonylcarbamoyladenine synthase
MRILAIETSCDETAAAIVEKRNSHVLVLSSIVASQADLHARTQGVVPEVAARAHVEAITYVLGDAIREGAGSGDPTSPFPLRSPSFAGRVGYRGARQAAGTIDAIAVTTEPGLRPALVVGETAGRALAVAWGKPFLPVHHIAGHIAAVWLVSDIQPAVSHRFPAVVLVVSGGHTQLYRLDEGFIVHLLGETRDDAAGEAFDKIARLLGLPYPGGPALSTLAEQGDACALELPRPMMDSRSGDFSFSGLKTAVFYAIRNTHLTEQERADVAASAQEAIVDVLVAKTVNAAAREDAKEVILTGGVAANQRLRECLKEALGSLPLVVPHARYCTDNAAMIGAAAALGLKVPGQEKRKIT